jgi:hypothetical protein
VSAVVAARTATGVRARCNRLSSLLVQNWNRRTGVEQELQSPHLTPARRAYLVNRHRQLCDEQDVLERQMTRMAERVEVES